jgi:hypothetical protein
VQFSRRHWRRDEADGAIRSLGRWEAVTVTWSPTATPENRRALATATHLIIPSIAELMTAGARHLLERQRGTRRIVGSSRRQLPTAAQALPRSGQLP